MKPMKLILMATFLTATAVGAQEPAFKRTVLQQGDLSDCRTRGRDRESRHPAGRLGRQAHTPGRRSRATSCRALCRSKSKGATKTVKAGEPFLIPAGKVHDAKNIGTGPAQVLATYIVEKGKPLATPVK